MISIIIAHFNRSTLLLETLHSVINQTIKEWEIIVIDDCSSTAEWEIVKNYKVLDNRIKVYKRQSTGKGPSTCRNEGAEKAQFPYLLFLDSDDLLKPFCLHQRLDFMRSKPGTEIAVFKEENFSKTPGDLNSYFNIDLPYHQLLPSFIQNNNPWQTMAPIWQADFFKRLGGFDVDLFYMEDPELHIRALLEVKAKVELCYDLPADCYYRANYNDGAKKDFYYNSIYYRILFYDKIATQLAAKGLISKFGQDYKKGIYQFIKQFMFARISEYPQMFKLFLNMLNNHSIFNLFEIRKIKWLIKIGSSQHSAARVLRLKGLCYRLFPA